MPVSFAIENGRLLVRQSFDFPTVYLDHWAIRHFSSKKADGRRFVQALRASGGTLIVSHTNLAEITGPADLCRADETANFLETVLPHIYFAMFDIESAMKQEGENRQVGIRLMAPPDIELLKEVARQRPDDFRPFTITGVIKIIADHRERLGVTWRQTNQSIADRINEMRRDPEFIRKAKSFCNHPINIPTMAVFQELLRPIYLDKRLKIDLNDGGDIQHAIISIVYCDFVLLDGKWKDMHERMKKRFAELGLIIPTAQVFSARRGGVEQFLKKLEATNPLSFEDGTETRQ